jgi:uncharacterized membrane-anchored protein YhcB (DUF1043 family)
MRRVIGFFAGRGAGRGNRAYSLLVVFSLLTVGASMYVSARVLGAYTTSVRVNQEWTSRSAAYRRLGVLAAQVNAPGNNVFASRDARLEMARFDTALSQFQTEILAARSALASQTRNTHLDEHLAETESAMADMAEDARAIFQSFARGRVDLAGEQMASMDQRFEAINAALRQLRADISEIQQGNFESQLEAATTLRMYEYLVAFAVVLMMLGMSVYGNRLYTIAMTDRAGEERILALEESERNFKSLAEAIPHMIWTTTADGTID